MQRWGRTGSGSVRYRCFVCRHTTVHHTQRHRRQQQCVTQWITGKDTQEVVARRYGVSARTLRRWRDSSKEPAHPVLGTPHTLILDATYFHGKAGCVLIARTDTGVLDWQFVVRESRHAWHAFLLTLPQPTVVVIDGQKGLFYAVTTLWPTTRIQRCYFHVVQRVVQVMTRHPHGVCE
jgi:hypothetical protein